MDAEQIKNALAYLAERKGRLFGAVLGIIIGLLWVFLGLFKALIFLFCVALGYFIGFRLDRRDSWRQILEKILPPTE